MKSLFCASAIMLMLFNYIEISSGMNPGEKKKKKARGVSLIGRNAILFHDQPEKPQNLRMEKDGHHLRLFDTETGTFVGDRPFSRDLHALSIQTTHIENREHTVTAPASKKVKNTRAPRNDKHASGSSAIDNYQPYKRTDGLLPEIRLPGGRVTDLQHQLHHSPYVSTPSLRGASASVLNPTSFNLGEQNLWNQPNHNQHVGTLHQEQPSVAGFNPTSFNPGEHNFWNQPDLNQNFSPLQEQPSIAGFDPQFFDQGQPSWGPQEHPYTQVQNLGQEEYFHPTQGLPPNTLFSESFVDPNLNQGSHWYYGSGHSR